MLSLFWLFLISVHSQRLLENVNITADDIIIFLDVHNVERNSLCNSNLTWNSILATRAQNLSSSCIMKHSNNGFGESLYGSTWIGHPAGAVYSWIDEKVDPGWNCLNSTCCSAETGHYTQVISKWSTEVGCGASVCSELYVYYTGQRLNNALYVVCNYNPAGNRGDLYDRGCCNGPGKRTTLNPTPAPTPYVLTGQNNGCYYLRGICAKKCGDPKVFGFDKCSSSIDNGVLSCRVPPNCTCDIPTEFRSTYMVSDTMCSTATCKDWNNLILGSLDWCNNCAYNCSGFQQNCIKDGFCSTMNKCSALEMCAKIRPTPAPSPNPTPLPSPNPTPNPTPQPSPNPTPFPTPQPSPNPTPQPSPNPTPQPSPQPSPFPTPQPSPNPTPYPTPQPSPRPTPEPSPNPTPQPSPNPTPEPSPNPTPQPSPNPTPSPISETYPVPESTIQTKFSWSEISIIVVLCISGTVLIAYGVYRLIKYYKNRPIHNNIQLTPISAKQIAKHIKSIDKSHKHESKNKTRAMKREYQSYV